MLYQRGKEIDRSGKKRKRIWWYRFRFAGRIVHESAKTISKEVARDAERQPESQTPEADQTGCRSGPASSGTAQATGRASHSSLPRRRKQASSRR